MTSFTSCFTPARPTSASSSASSSSRGRAGRSSAAGVAFAVAAAAAVVEPAAGCRALRRLDGAEQHAAEPLDGGQLVLGGVEVDGRHREGDLDGVRVVRRGRGPSRPWRRPPGAPRTWPTAAPRSRAGRRRGPSRAASAGVAPASWVSSSGPNAPRTSQSSSSLTRRSMATRPQTRLNASSATSPRRRSTGTEANPRLTASREAVTSSMKRRVGSTSDSLIRSLTHSLRARPAHRRRSAVVPMAQSLPPVGREDRR